MTVRDLLTAELTLEAAFTRMHLERVPMDRLDYKAHDKSMTLGWLATFLAIMPTWGGYTLTRDSFDVAPPGGQAPRPEIARSSADLLKMFDANVADVRAALATIGEDRLAEPWTLLAAGRQIFSQPRALVFQTYLIHHMVHHRAQLGLYLRLTGVAVPAVYNSSADEAGGMFIGR